MGGMRWRTGNGVQVIRQVGVNEVDTMPSIQKCWFAAKVKTTKTTEKPYTETLEIFRKIFVSSI